MRATLFSVVAVTVVLLSGCGFLRNIEQWKCDNMGMCHFGITPSVPYQQPWDAAAYPPVSGYNPAENVILQELPREGLGLPSPHCENCQL